MSDEALENELAEADAGMVSQPEPEKKEGEEGQANQLQLPASVPDYQNAAIIAQISAHIQNVLITVVNVASPLFPTLGQVYTDETVKAVGDSVAPVVIKRKWKPAGWIEKYQEELAAAAVLIPVSVSTVNAIRFDLERREKEVNQEGETVPGETHHMNTEGMEDGG